MRPTARRERARLVTWGRADGLAVRGLLVGGVLVAGACAPTDSVGPVSLLPTTVRIVDPPTRIAVHEQVPLTALVDQADAAPPPTVVWTTSDSALVTVDAGGTIGGRGEGLALLAATVRGVADSAWIEVRGFLVDASGGSATSSDAGARIVVPPGALPDSAVVEIELTGPETLATLDMTRIVPGTVHAFQPDTLAFSESVEIRIAYDPEALPPGIADSLLRLARIAPGEGAGLRADTASARAAPVWEILAGSAADPVAREVVGVVDALGVIAVAWLPPPPEIDEPPEARITAPVHGTSAPLGSTFTFIGEADDEEDGPLTGDALAWSSNQDGQLGTGRTLSTAALTLGTHRITLTATDASGGIDRDRITIAVVNSSPAATITAPVAGTSVPGGIPVSFTGSATDAEDGPLVGGALVWTSDLDGAIGTGISFTTSTLSIGLHTITLTATDSQGGSGISQITISILNNDPVAAILAPTDGTTALFGTSVTFTGSGTDVEDGSLSGAALVWSSDVDGQFGTGTSVSTNGLSLGAHIVTLAATDSHGGTDSRQISLTVSNNASPTASIVAPGDGSSFAVGTIIGFAGNGTDPEEGGLTGGSLVWTSDLDGQIGTGANFLKSTLSIGVHTITLTATDSQGAVATDQITVTITNADPVAAIVAPVDGSVLASALPVAFVGTGIDAEDGVLSGASLVWTSDLDGQIGTGGSFSAALSAGTHVITLTVTDSDGGIGTTQITIVVT